MLPPSDLDPDLQRLKWLLVNATLDLKLELLGRAIKAAFNPDQSRDELGRWTDGGEARPAPRTQKPSAPGNTVVAQVGFGRLIAEIPVRGGRYCVYNFGSYSIIAPGAVNLRCSARVPSSAVTHGRLLNDN